jgi:hypothetical protein
MLKKQTIAAICDKLQQSGYICKQVHGKQAWYIGIEGGKMYILLNPDEGWILRPLEYKDPDMDEIKELIEEVIAEEEKEEATNEH